MLKQRSHIMGAIVGITIWIIGVNLLPFININDHPAMLMLFGALVAFIGDRVGESYVGRKQIQELPRIPPETVLAALEKQMKETEYSALKQYTVIRMWLQRYRD